MFAINKFDDNAVFSFKEVKREAKKYKGYDWAEVYFSLGLDNCSPTLKGSFSVEKALADDEIAYNRLRNEIATIYEELPPWGKGLSARSKDVLLACRAYSYAAGTLSKSHDYKKPMWYGMSIIGDDGEFLKMYSLVFPHVWD